ncbi:hypothetical protein GGF32_006903 [Allomyces javanicus]|nr:hypothetical protein GGF32_006903 [Allomyces javanicus]
MPGTPLPADVVEMAIFEQLLEMDDDARIPTGRRAGLGGGAAASAPAPASMAFEPQQHTDARCGAPHVTSRPPDPGFSQSLVDNFFEQAEGTLKEMQLSLASQNLEALSRQGHFLKGSAAALGIVKLKKAFEKIQYLGQGKDESGAGSSAPDQALARIAQLMNDVNAALAEAHRAFAAYYQ